MRRALLVLVPLAAWPAGAGAQATAVTLKAPKATTYLHRIEFDGRVVPARPGTSVRLLRGAALVAIGRVRGDGTYRIPVLLASPGPFHVVAGTAVSSPVTVRIRPRLQAGLVGSRVLGAPLQLVAALDPPAAGAVRIQVIRSGRLDFDQRYLGHALVALGTSEIGTIRVRVSAVPRTGYEGIERELTATLLPSALSAGMTSPAVSALARRLAALHYAVPSFSPTFGDDLAESVIAFQKVQGLDRTGTVDAGLWTRLANPKVPHPRYSQPAGHIEVDKAHQVLYVVRDGKIALISPVATAGIPGYYTPEGRFAIYRKVTGWDTSPLGVLWNPMYFVGGYAIHGGDPVPPYPASHGCVRVPDFVIERLFPAEPYGETVYVY